MKTLFENLIFSDLLQLILILITTITAVLSIVISVLTLRQNQKMLEESTRPYIVIYGTITNFQEPIYKLIIKNFGQSGGTITSFNSSHDLVEFTFGEDERRPFEDLKDIFIAPGQSIISAIDYKKIMEKEIDILNFNIKYKTQYKSYTEDIDINVKAFKNQISPKASTGNKELKIISYTLQELVDKLL